VKKLLLNYCGHHAISSLIKLISLVRNAEWYSVRISLSLAIVESLIDRAYLFVYPYVFVFFLTSLSNMLIFWFLAWQCFATFDTNLIYINYMVHVWHRWVYITLGTVSWFYEFEYLIRVKQEKLYDYINWYNIA